MKKALLFGLITLMLLPLVIAGCNKAKASSNETTTPATYIGPPKVVDVTLDDFTAQNNIVRDIELIRPASLLVYLGSNPTTGYQWGEAVINDTSVVAQASHNYVAPKTTAVGAAGKDVWMFDSKTAGTTMIKFSYSRPWEGGEKGIYTLTINVTVK